MKKRIFVLAVVLIVLFTHYKTPSIVLLSFDVESVDSSEDVLGSLSVLDKNNVKGTFFMTGEFMLREPELVKEISLRHEIGCHTFNHSILTKLDLHEKELQVGSCNFILERMINKSAVGFRAPYNRIDSESLVILEKYGYEYDASYIENYGWLFPSLSVEEVWISSFTVLPLEDFIYFYYLKSPWLFFFLAKTKNAETLSLLFHPHHAVKELEMLDEMIKYFKWKKAVFLTHEEMVKRIVFV